MFAGVPPLPLLRQQHQSHAVVANAPAAFCAEARYMSTDAKPSVPARWADLRDIAAREIAVLKNGATLLWHQARDATAMLRSAVEPPPPMVEDATQADWDASSCVDARGVWHTFRDWRLLRTAMFDIVLGVPVGGGLIILPGSFVLLILMTTYTPWLLPISFHVSRGAWEFAGRMAADDAQRVHQPLPEWQLEQWRSACAAVSAAQRACSPDETQKHSSY
ncbi:hypothetical protein EON66_11165, partial [archaeon]